MLAVHNTGAVPVKNGGEGKVRLPIPISSEMASVYLKIVDVNYVTNI